MGVGFIIEILGLGFGKKGLVVVYFFCEFFIIVEKIGFF